MTLNVIVEISVTFVRRFTFIACMVSQRKQPSSHNHAVTAHLHVLETSWVLFSDHLTVIEHLNSASVFPCF